VGLQLPILNASTERDFDAALATAARLRVGAVVTGTDMFFPTQGEQLAALAGRHALPAIFQYREFTAAAAG
jgi:putative tryptophan/tyrosine transport system substrate-binding protein